MSKKIIDTYLIMLKQIQNILGTKISDKEKLEFVGFMVNRILEDVKK